MRGRTKDFWRRHSFKLLVGVALILIVAVLLNYFNTFHRFVSTDQAVWGQFGDYFGGVLNPLLSFFALVGLMVTLKGQQEEGDKAEKRHEQQTFDARLFQLLSLSHEAVSAVKFIRPPHLTHPREEFEGHRGVAYALNRLQEEYLYKVPRGSAEFYSALSEQFLKWKIDYWSGVASYIESMLFILKYVMDKKVGSDSYDFALQAVFAQMSSDEKLLVYYVMVFESRQKILISQPILKNFIDGASPDDLLPWREQLLHAAVLSRLKPSQ